MCRRRKRESFLLKKRRHRKSQRARSGTRRKRKISLSFFIEDLLWVSSVLLSFFLASFFLHQRSPPSLSVYLSPCLSNCLSLFVSSPSLCLLQLSFFPRPPKWPARPQREDETLQGFLFFFSSFSLCTLVLIFCPSFFFSSLPALFFFRFCPRRWRAWKFSLTSASVR